jgi:hypothetical protein
MHWGVNGVRLVINSSDQVLKNDGLGIFELALELSQNRTACFSLETELMPSV